MNNKVGVRRMKVPLNTWPYKKERKQRYICYKSKASRGYLERVVAQPRKSKYVPRGGYPWVANCLVASSKLIWKKIVAFKLS